MNIEFKDFTTIIAALITSGAFYGWVKFFLRRREDSGAVVVKTAEGVVVMQTSIIKDLREDNDKIRKDNDQLREEIEGLKKRIQELELKLEMQAVKTIETDKHIAELENPK